ncbi:MAG TPA: HPP family protein [Methylococcus sp.]|nr:HPP family protein [Methylococcus sp.]
MNRLHFLGKLIPEPAPVRTREKIRAGLGAGLAILGTGWIAGRFLEGQGLNTLLASMGASSVILFAVPHSPMARSWAVAGGHLLSALIGIVCARLVHDAWAAGGLAVGLSVFLMYVTRCLHPPGGATALVAALGGESVHAMGFQFLLTPVALNVLTLISLAGLFRLPQQSQKLAAPPQPRSHEDPTPLERLGIRTADLRAALRDMDTFVDVSEDELNAIYERAADRVLRREFGEVTCAHIMSRDLVTVEFGEPLEATWELMRREGVGAIPVVDRARHVIGIITLGDFVRHADSERFASLGSRIRRLLRASPKVTSDKPEVAGQIMSAPVVTAREDQHIATLAGILIEKGVRQVPIVDQQGKLIGLVTQADLLGALSRLALARDSRCRTG